MKVVAVSQRVDSYHERGEVRDALDQGLVEFILAAGFLPVPVPNSLSAESDAARSVRTWLDAIAASAVVLSGGNDVGSCSSRDLTEKSLLDYAEQKKLPVLGVCRGMQMMGVRAGCVLRSVKGHVRTRHLITGEISRNVNSYHNLVLSDCPDNFTVLARSADGEVEAIRHRVLPWEGWMWHPERELTFASDDLDRLKSLFSGR